MNGHARIAWAPIVLTLVLAGCQDLGSGTVAGGSWTQSLRTPGVGPETSRAQGPEAPVSGNGNRAARIVAVVNGELILDEDVRSAGYQALMQARTQQEQRKVLDETLEQLIDREAVLQEAFSRLTRGSNDRLVKQLEAAAGEAFTEQVLDRMKQRHGIKQDAELERYLGQFGMSLPMIRRHWVRNFMMRQYLISRIGGQMGAISHAEISDYYDAHAEEFRVDDAVEWQDIFIAVASHGNSRERARRFAEVLVKRIRAGESFASLAAQNFNDGDSKLRDGRGEGTKRGEIRPVEVEEVVFRLREGEIGPLVELPTGFHIVRVAKRQFAGKKPFDEEVQKEIRNKLRQQIFERESKDIVEELKARAVIERMGPP